jgi:hypothetical protein
MTASETLETNSMLTQMITQEHLIVIPDQTKMILLRIKLSVTVIHTEFAGSLALVFGVSKAA